MTPNTPHPNPSHAAPDAQADKERARADHQHEEARRKALVARSTRKTSAASPRRATTGTAADEARVARFRNVLEKHRTEISA